MRRYKYIGRDGSSGYRTGKHYWGYTEETPWRVTFYPLNPMRNNIYYTAFDRFKADWE